MPDTIHIDLDRALMVRLEGKELAASLRERRDKVPTARLIDLLIAESLSRTGFAAVLVRDR